MTRVLAVALATLAATSAACGIAAVAYLRSLEKAVWR